MFAHPQNDFQSKQEFTTTFLDPPGDLAMLVFKLIIFVLASIGIIYVSRSSLRHPRSHGFYRFFAWETTLALALLNIDHWFDDPFSPWQIVSWLFLVVSLLLVILGVQLLRLVGKPDKHRQDENLYEVEKTSQLVTVGAYRYIRHPMYSSLLFLAWGIFFKLPSLVGGALAVMATIFLVLTARIEEAENIRFFGDSYVEYMRKTKMFVPYLF
jgi:protein-S-isoprenylcysteine O-methyltransferase Ste14